MEMGKRTMPKGWSLNRMVDVCYVNPPRKNMNSKDPNFKTSFIPMGAIDETTGSISRRVSRPFSEVSKGYTYFEDGDILFAKITPCMQNGKSAIAENLIEGFGFGSTEFHVLRPKPGVNKKWIYHFIRTQEYRKKAQDHFEGSAGQQRVSTAFIENSLIPLPPTLEDQLAIANELERKMAEVEKMRQAALRQKEAAEAIHEAIFREIFPRHIEANIKKGWVSIRVKKVSQKIQYGITKAATTEKLGPKLLRITDIQNGSVNWDKVPYCDCEKNEYEKYLLEKDDILFVRTGATTGKSYLIKEPKKALFASYLIRVQCDNKIVNPRYLYSFFQSPFYWKLIGKGSRGGTLSGFNASMLSEMLIPIPRNLDEQLAIANKIEKKTEELNKTNQAIAIQLEAIQALPAAILREVFDFQEANA